MNLKKYTYTTKHIETIDDEILAFGMTKEADPRFVFLGNKYWYVINKQDSQKLLNLLQTKFKYNFIITNDQKMPYLSESGKAVQEELIIKAEYNNFTSSFCLHYQTADKKELKKLEELNFTFNEKTAFYQYCISLKGSLYQAKSLPTTQQRMKQSIPITVIVTGMLSHEQSEFGKIVNKVSLTPMALALDVMTFPLVIIALPFMLLD
ncbi:hypothetical protein EV694_0337 [Volucribacter psittacicida]|uniref:Uncharacterized protein n=1 Tax=Volucribacter psittacicida TaxID=203482 RepID=A0A4R1G5I9_9PAST|nr:hypothetical protein [Volucribacter psittacicida]TCK01715.1 hypothetical protein EV694_0337 [Volucribacter psittacicida]